MPRKGLNIQGGASGRGRGVPPIFDHPDQLAPLIDDYFERCKESGETPMIIPLALAVGLSRQGLAEYGQKPLFAALVSRARDMCAQELYMKGLDRTYEPSLVRLGLASHHGFTEKTSVEHTVRMLTREQAESMTDEEIAAALAAMPSEDR
jgi:hypothetical protein